MKLIERRPSLFAALLFTVAATGLQAEEFETLVIEDDTDETLIIDSTAGESEDGQATLIDEGENDMLMLDEEQETAPAPDNIAVEKSSSAVVAKLDRLWVEYGHFAQQRASKNQQGYAHGLASIEWRPSDQWEFKASARADGYTETGRDDWGDVELDYDETFIRYKAASSTFTLGMQKILWGRIDEFPPTDRLSTQDFRRFVLDDLEDRRLASLAFRMEHFFDNKKIDLVYYPHFREAQLADRDSIWYPVNKQTGEILSLDTTDAAEAIVKAVPVVENPPDSDGGFGARFSSISNGLDYGVTVQHGRQTVPYFSYDPVANVIEGKYPRTWILGGDFGVEALGGTLKFEANWMSDTPVTRLDGSYTTVKSMAWGAALELFPGDGDARLNLQLMSVKLLGSPAVMDRDEMYAFNGSYQIPFANNQWRATTRFNVGLDEKDVYLNPEIAYTGWDSQEIYLEFHFFDGDKGTPGGFYEDNSLVTLGWRADF
ncbi:MAG: hypothetical protein R3E57_05455 [Porticoccaceae bacterium]